MKQSWICKKAGWIKGKLWTFKHCLFLAGFTAFYQNAQFTHMLIKSSPEIIRATGKRVWSGRKGTGSQPFSRPENKPRADLNTDFSFSEEKRKKEKKKQMERILIIFLKEQIAQGLSWNGIPTYDLISLTIREIIFLFWVVLFTW